MTLVDVHTPAGLAFHLLQAARLRPLPDRKDDHIRRDHFSVSGNSSKSGLAIRETAEIDVHRAHAGHFLTGIAGDLLERARREDLDTLFFRFATSQTCAGICSRPSRQVIPTQAAPRRTALMAVSMATLPPPNTSTRRPKIWTRDLCRVRVMPSSSDWLTWRKNCVAWSTPGRSLPGMGSLAPPWAPIATNTASYSSSSASISSTRWFSLSSIPWAMIASISRWTMRRQAMGRHAHPHHAARHR